TSRTFDDEMPLHTDIRACLGIPTREVCPVRNDVKRALIEILVVGQAARDSGKLLIDVWETNTLHNLPFGHPPYGAKVHLTGEVSNNARRHSCSFHDNCMCSALDNIVRLYQLPLARKMNIPPRLRPPWAI